MPIRVQAPDGTLVEFPDGTDREVMRSAMAKRFPAGSQFATPGAELRSYEPTLRDQLGSLVQDGLSALGFSNQKAGQAAANITGSRGLGTEQMGGVDLVPGLSNVLAGTDAQRDFQEGRNVSGTLNTIAAGLAPGPVGAGVKQAGQQGARLAAQASAINQQAPGTKLVVPRAMDPDPNAVSKTFADAAGRGAGVPVLGTPLQEGVQAARTAANTRVGEAVARSGADAGIEGAGRFAQDQLGQWMHKTTKDEVSTVFEAARNMVPEGFTGQVPRLTNVLKQLAARDNAAGTAINKPVRDAIEGAVNRGFLTLDGAKDLRDFLSKQANPGAAVAQTGAESGFKQAAGALEQDIKAMIAQGGGQRATQAMRSAKEFFKRQKKTRDAVEIVMGKGAKEGAVSAERLVNRVTQLAKQSSGGDARSLARIKSVMDKGAWGSLARQSHEILGRNASGAFDPLKWSKEYQKLSNNGKVALYGKTLKAEYDNLSDFMIKFVNAQGRVGNPSRSGDLLAGAGLIQYTAESLAAGAGHALFRIMGARSFMRYWGNPRVIKAASKVARMSGRVTGPQGANVLRAAIQDLANEVSRAGGDGNALISVITGEEQ